MSRNTKLSMLALDWGFVQIEEFVEAYAFDSVAPGICMNEGCNYSTDVEPDQGRGWCENCETNTVVSGLILAGFM